MTLGNGDNHDDNIQDYIAADDEGEISVAEITPLEALSAVSTDLANGDGPDESPGIASVLAVEIPAQESSERETRRNLDDRRFQHTGIPISVPTATDENEALQERRAVPKHSDEYDNEQFLVEGDQDLGGPSVHRSTTAGNDGDHERLSSDYPTLDTSLPGQFTHHSQLQTMADLLHRHQLEQSHQDMMPGVDDRRDLAVPLQTQPGEGSSSTLVHVGDVSQPAPGEHSIEAVPSRLKDASNPQENLLPLSSSPASAFIPPALRPPSTVLGKRKASSEIVEEAALSGSESLLVDEETDECLGLADPTTQSGKKKRKSRARKPQELPPSKVIGQSLVQSTPVIMEVPPAPEPQIFKHESRRKWRRIDPYVAIMKVIMKERLKDGWTVMMNSIAEVTADGEQKDKRRVKQTWANEYTRLKSQAEKGRLVTLADLNCSWPWNLMEKKVLWMTGVALCANKVTWAVVAAEASRVARNCGEKPVTEEECKAEWDNVLKHEYMDTPPPSNRGLTLITRHDSSTKDQVTQQHSSETTLESASSNTNSISSRTLQHSKTKRSHVARVGDTYDRDGSSDFLHADESLLRLLEDGPFSERPLNQPLQVQPPRDPARKDYLESDRTSTSAGVNVDDTRKSNLEVVINVPQAEAVDDASEVDEGDYVILGEDDVEAVPTK